MKKIFTLLSIAFGSFMFGQSFAVYKTNNAQTSITNTITNGYNLEDLTSAGLQTKATFKIVNKTAATLTLNIVRSVEFENPTMFLDGSTNTPSTYFCFGNTCFPSNVNSVSAFDYTILGPAGATSAPFDNSKDNGQPFIVYFDEGAAVGKYFIRYTISNVNNLSDQVSFLYIYNDFAGISENTKTLEEVGNVYPNPATNQAHVSFNLNEAASVKTQVYNSLGALVYNGAEQMLAGKNKLNIDCSNYNSGLYFVTITAGGTKITKRLVVDK